MSDLAEDTTEYVLATRSGDIVGCFRCDSAAPTTEVRSIHLSGEHDKPDAENQTKRVCKFCYETELGHILAYPRGNGDLPPLARALCQAFNLIHWDGKTVPEVEVSDD